MEESAEFAEIVRSERLRLGLTQRELAEQVDVTDSYIAHLERGKLPSPRTALRLAAAFGYSAEESERLQAAAELARVERSRRRLRRRGLALRRGLRSLDVPVVPGAIRLFELPTGVETKPVWTAGRQLVTLAFAPGPLVAGGGDGLVVVWDRESGAERYELAGEGGLVRAVAFSPDGRRCVTGDDRGALVFRDAAGGHATRRLELESGIAAVGFSPDGDRLVVLDASGGAQLLNAINGMRLGDVGGGGSAAVSAFAFAPDGGTLAVGHADGTVVVRAVEGGREVTRLEHGGAVEVGREVMRLEHGGAVAALAYPSDGGLLATAGAGVVRLWDPEAGGLLRDLPAGGAAVVLLAFLPDGVGLAGVAADGPVRVWDTRTGAVRRTIELPGGPFPVLAVSPGGRLLGVHDAAYTERGAQGVDVAELARELEGDEELRDALRDLRVAMSDPDLRDAVTKTLRAMARGAGTG